MANTIPLVPQLNVLEQDPITKLVLVGKITGSIPSGTTYAGIFAKSCILEATDTGDDWFMTGTVANPSWTVVTTGAGITSITGDVVAAGPGAASATVEGLFGVDLNAAATVDASFYLYDSSVFNPVVMSGDVTMDNTGATTLEKILGKVVNAALTVSGSFYVYDGVDIEPVSMSGDATMIASGAVTLADTVKVYTAKVTVSNAEIKTLFSVGKLLVAAPTAGHVIQVLSVVGRINFSTAAFAAHTALEVVDHTTGNVLFSDASALLASASTVIATVPENANSGVGVIQTTAGAIWAKVATGDPTTGGGTLDLYVTYKVVAL